MGLSLLVLACTGARPGGAALDGPLAESSRDSSPATPDSDSGCAARAFWPDADAAVNPAAAEDCATEDDDDCDGSADATDALHCTTWYADEDGDGYGGEAVCACVAPWGDASLTTGGDCDDTDPTLNESCTVYVDSTYTADLNHVYWLTHLGDVTGDGLADLGVGEVVLADEDAEGGDGAVYLFATPRGALSLGDADVTVSDSKDWYFGTDVADGGDLTGDGYDDLFVIDADHTAFVFAGPLAASSSADDAVAVIDGPSWVYAFYQVDGLGDVDGDGRADVAISSADWIKSGVWIFTGPLAGALSIDDAAGFHGEYEEELEAHTFLAGPGDVDGDGLADVALAAVGRVELLLGGF